MSAILSADDLNDFISPGVACIKPVEITKTSDNTEIQIGSDGAPLEVSIDGSTKTLSAAQISLADCLACSGCITSAEEVLVAQHSHNELLKNLKENTEGKIFVASISHQSRASLATAYGISVDSVDKYLANLFINKLGFRYVVGTGLGRKISLAYESHSMVDKKQNNNVNGPTLSSVCPGWVLYAEKTHPYVLPRISTTKSPQQITGLMLKELSARELNVPRESIYHLSIMPCFDKKLEAARPEQDGKEQVDVDCVITAKELIQLLEQENLILIDNSIINEIQNTTMNNLYTNMAPANWPSPEISWSNDEGSTSGGYALNYLSSLKKHLVSCNSELSDLLAIKVVQGRNSDILELRLVNSNTNEVYGNSSIVNGFRNIQNLVRKLKPGAKVVGGGLAARRKARVAIANGQSGDSVETADASKCDYVEIMACPNGCINGGGQIAAPAEINEKEWLTQVETNYNAIAVGSLDEFDIINWCRLFCKEFEIEEDRLINTYFNQIEKSTDPAAILLGAKW